MAAVPFQGLRPFSDFRTRAVLCPESRLDWSERNSTRTGWGEGTRIGSCYPIVEKTGIQYYPYFLWTYGRVEIQCKWMRLRPPFTDDAQMSEWARRLNEIPGVEIRPEDWTRRGLRSRVLWSGSGGSCRGTLFVFVTAMLEATAATPPNDIIVRDRDILGGTPVFRGTRVPFQALLDYLEAGQTIDEFLMIFPPFRRTPPWRHLNSRNRFLPANWDGSFLLDASAFCASLRTHCPTTNARRCRTLVWPGRRMGAYFQSPSLPVLNSSSQWTRACSTSKTGPAAPSRFSLSAPRSNAS